MTAVRRGVGVRAALTPAVLGAVAATVVCAVGSTAADGWAGLAAALLAGSLVLAFLLAGQLPVAEASRGRPGLGALLVLVGYLARVFLLLVVFVLVVNGGFPDRTMFGVDLMVVALGWTAGTVWSLVRWKPPVVDVELPADRAHRQR
jgi:hypothetical protein